MINYELPKYHLHKWGYEVFFLPRKSGAKKNTTPHFIEKILAEGIVKD